MGDILNSLGRGSGPLRSDVSPSKTVLMKSTTSKKSPCSSSASSSTEDINTSKSSNYGEDMGDDFSISNSEESEDDDSDDPLKMLTGSLSGSSVRRSLSSLSAKRSDVFEDDKSGLKRLKMPPVIKAPFLKKNDGSLLRKSAVLQKLHDEDEKEAVKQLGQKTTKDAIIEGLHKAAVSNTEYVDYLASHKDDLELDDFHFIKETPYIKPKSIRDPIELYIMPGMIRHLPDSDFDIFNELEEGVVKQEIQRIGSCEIDMEEIRRYMINIGAGHKTLDVTYIVSEDDLDMDSKKKTQDIQLIITKFHYLVKKILHSEYSPEKFEFIVKIFGFFMMDKRVFSTGSSTLFSELINSLISWKCGDTSKIELGPIVNSWYSSTDQLQLVKRIVETLNSEVSIVIAELRILLSLHIFLQGQIKDLKFIEDPIQFNMSVYSQIYQKLIEWNKHGKDFFSSGDFFKTKIEFQCLFQCLKFVQIENENDLDQIRYEVERLRTKVSTKFHDSEQASLKSLLLLIFTVLQFKQVGPRE